MTWTCDLILGVLFGLISLFFLFDAGRRYGRTKRWVPVTLIGVAVVFGFFARMFLMTHFDITIRGTARDHSVMPEGRYRVLSKVDGRNGYDYLLIAPMDGGEPILNRVKGGWDVSPGDCIRRSPYCGSELASWAETCPSAPN